MATHFGRRIKYIRESLGLDREEFGQILSLHERKIFEIETGKRFIQLDRLLLIAQNWPQFSAYLLNGNTDVPQLDPETELLARELTVVGGV